MIDITSGVPAVTPRRPRQSLLPGAATRKKLRKRRALKDRLSRWGVSAAGFGVVFALTMIFVYLFYEVMPIFRGASVEIEHRYPAPGSEAVTQHLLLERYEQLGLQYTQDGRVIFFEQNDGSVRSDFNLPLPSDVSISSSGAAEVITGLHVKGLSDGSALLLRHAYDFSFPDDRRYIAPRLEYPFGESPLVVDELGRALRVVAVESSVRGVDTTLIGAVTDDNRLLLTVLNPRRNMLTGETTVQRNSHELPAAPAEIVTLLISKDMRSLFAVDVAGVLHYYDIANPAAARLVQSVLVADGERVTAAAFLVGTVSLIMGTDRGNLSQWFLVRDDENRFQLERVREFRSHGAEITALAPEYTRKGFIAADAAGQIGIHYGTSARTLFLREVSERPLAQVAVSQINGRILAMDDRQQILSASLWNQHPQLSFSALWNRVWYEGRAGPEYIWQSSSGSDEFESKFSLVPLSVGTLKAAFYAMLFAIPLAIAGAIYTAYFMTPKLRGLVKPSIEIMEALPTVILGFLAGLWLAPFAENNLPAVFSILLLMPVFMLLFAFAWTRLPAPWRGGIPDGWEVALLVPVILLFGYAAIKLSPWVEIWFFGGSMRQWFTDIGITYDQRNALVVGIAMGFAVIPTIFSIAEDAVFTVPKHLTQGSLALGATRWQTVMGVVLPTASPGIFSAVMMGFGRAVGETMIVLMATGNSPVVNFNIFEGMRTLSANIAVELPETAVGSSHFRVLFLAALVLLTLTFVVNTVAEIIRQRLRARYSNL